MTDWCEGRWRKRANAHVSWSGWFARRAVARMRIEHLLATNSPHAAAGWSMATPHNGGKGLGERLTAAVTGHAPWLNAEAIGYRNVIGAKQFNGVYIA